MKTLSILILSGLLCLSCADENEIIEGPLTPVGTWKISEVLADPGDGSGTFQPTDSQQTIAIHEDGRFTANFTFCYEDSFSQLQYTGTVDYENNLLISDHCENRSFTFQYLDLDDAFFIILPCIEPCMEKYERISFSGSL